MANPFLDLAEVGDSYESKHSVSTVEFYNCNPISNIYFSECQYTLPILLQSNDNSTGLESDNRLLRALIILIITVNAMKAKQQLDSQEWQNQTLHRTHNWCSLLTVLLTTSQVEMKAWELSYSLTQWQNKSTTIHFMWLALCIREKSVRHNPRNYAISLTLEPSISWNLAR